MSPETEAMISRLTDVPKRKLEDAQDSAKIAMRMLIRSANLDRRLLSDLDWQQAMTHLNAIIREEK